MKAAGAQAPRRTAPPRAAHTSRRSARSQASERQADRAAERFLRGDRGLGHLITPAPTAGFVLPGSSGRPLPSPLRRELEEAFGADLRAVRIYHDEPAAAAALGFGARAFASGANLYFGEGLFRPQTTAGRHLIAHEIAHVLQQTGRAASGGLIASTPVAGGGLVQRVEIPDFDTLRPAHAPVAKGKDRAKFDEVADQLAALVTGPNPAEAVEAYAKGVLPLIGPQKWPHQAESLLYDTLKHYGKFEMAAQLIERDRFLGGNRINTVGTSSELVEALETRNGSWAVYLKAIDNIPWLKAYETEWLRLFDVFLFQSTNVMPALFRPQTKGTSSEETLLHHVQTLFDELADNKTVSNNEWVYHALLLLADLDALRIRKCIEIWNNTSGDPRRMAQGRAGGVAALGQRFSELFDELPTLSKLGRAAAIKVALKPYLASLGKKIEASGVAAQAVLEQGKFLIDLVGASEAKAPPEGKELAKRLEARRTLASQLAIDSGMPMLLVEFLNEINRSEPHDDRLLDSVTYRDRVKPWAEKFTTFLRDKLDAPQPALFAAKRNDELLAWMALSWWLRDYLAHVRWTLSESVPDMKRAPLSTPDEVRYHRIFLARWVKTIAEPLSWVGVVDAANAILEARLESKSVVAIRSFDDGEIWKLNQEGERNIVERARQDFGNRLIKGWPVGLDMLAEFYTSTFYNELASQLRQRLPKSAAEEKRIVDQNAATPYLISPAYKATKVALPTRWETRGADYAHKAQDPRSFGDVLRAHPFFIDLVNTKQPPGYLSIVPEGPPLVFAWFVPPFDLLIEAMKLEPLLNSLVAATFTDEKALAKRPELALKLTASAWFARLSKVITDKLKDENWVKTEWAKVYREIAAVSSTMLRTSRESLQIEFKRAMRRDRQLVAIRLKVALESYAKDHHDLVAISDAMRLVRQFYAVNLTLEDADRGRQLALLLLEVAATLKSTLESERNFSIVFPFLGMMEQALESAPSLKFRSAAERELLMPPHQNSDAWLDARTAELAEITATLREVRDEVQKGEGFRADKDAATIAGFVKYSSPLPIAGTVFQPRYGGFLGQPSASGYRVMEIVHSFVFHPAYGGEDDPAAKKGPRTGYRAIQILDLDDKTPLAVPPTEPLLKIEILAIKNGQWVTTGNLVNVTSADTDRLNDLHNGILWGSFGSAMSNIQAGIEQFLEFYLDAAELLPGVGPAIAAARISKAVLEFLVSGDYEAITDMLSGNLTDIVKSLWQAIENSLDPENLLLLLLFGDPRLDALLAHSTLGAGGKKVDPDLKDGGKTVGTLKRTINALRRLGRAVFKLLRKLETRVERPMQDVRSFASTRPLVSFSLNYAADHIFQILTMVDTIQKVMAKREEKGGEKDLEESLKKQVGEQQKGFGERLSQILHALETLKLPEKVIDITPAVSKVLTFAEATIIKKAGFEGKVVSLALKHSGGYDFINDHIARAIVKKGDPNVYWKEEIVPKIEGRFNETRDAVVEQVNRVLASPTFKQVFDTVPPVGAMKIPTDEKETFADTSETYIPSAEEVSAGAPDTSPAPSPDRPLRIRPPQVPQIAGGARLSMDLRDRFEESLGQDLGHVRMHTGSNAAAMTDAFGADALTSGSHVFLRPGRAPDRDPTLVGHELVHVVQQTGGRPVGRPHDDRPVRGHPERGLSWDPARELEADEVARAMSRRPEPRALGSASGLQPSGVNWFTMARMMREMSNLQAVKTRAEIIDKEPKGGELPKEVAATVAKILETLKTKTLDKAVVVPLKPFESVMQLVQNRLKDKTYADPIAKAAKEIAFEALDPSPAVAGGAQHLSPRHFERQLEGYVLFRTGLAFVFDLNTTKVTEGGKEIEVVDPSNPVKTIKLAHIHLPYMDGRAAFWAQAIENTWPSPTHTADYRTKMRKALRPFLESRGIAPGIWPMFGSSYRFSLWFKGEAEAELKRLASETPDPVPSWQEYVKTDKDLPDKIGLRLAYYDHGSQTATGRQSHHLTQYLLADFFSNSNASAAFVAGRDYPGVTVDSTTKAVTSIAAQDKGSDPEKTIDVAATKGKGRGAQMPTLSLAAVTHQSGKLHVTPEADESAGGTKKTQGDALKNEFNRQLPPPLAAADSSTYQAYFKAHSRDDAAEAIYKAAQATYASVERHMSTQLAKNMPQLEFDYYLGLVENTSQDIRDPTTPDVKTDAETRFLTALRAIPAQAKEENEKQMREKFGWRLKV